MFFDVFPTLEVNGDMKKLLSETEVTKVGMNHEKDHIRIYLNGKRLIHKKNIYQLEKTYMTRSLKTDTWMSRSLKNISCQSSIQRRN